MQNQQINTTMVNNIKHMRDLLASAENKDQQRRSRRARWRCTARRNSNRSNNKTVVQKRRDGSFTKTKSIPRNLGSEDAPLTMPLPRVSAVILENNNDDAPVSMPIRKISIILDNLASGFFGSATKETISTLDDDEVSQKRSSESKTTPRPSRATS